MFPIMKMPKAIFLKTIIISSIFPIITFALILPRPKLYSGFSNLMLAKALTRQKIN